MSDAIRRDTTGLVASHVYYKIAGVVVLAILGRVLPDAELGRYFFAVSVAAPLLLVAHLGTSPLIGRRVASSGDAAAFLPFLGLRGASGVVFLAALGVLAATQGGSMWLLVLTAGLVGWMETVHAAFGALFIAAARVRFNVTIGVVVQTIFIASLAICLAVSPTVASVMTADVIRAVLLVGAAAYLAHTRVVPLRLRWDTTLLREGAPFLLLAAGTSVAGSLTTASLGWFGTLDDVARFGLAYRVIVATVFLGSNVGVVLSRELARDGVTPATRGRFEKTALGLLAISAAGALFLSFVAEDVCVLLYGSTHRDVGPVLTFLAPVLPLLQWTTFAGQSLQAIKRERTVIVATCSGAIATLATLPFAMPMLGARGAAIAICVGAAVHATIVIVTVLRVGLGSVSRPLALAASS